MTKKHSHKKPSSRRPSRSPPRLADCAVTIIGLGGIGRQIALQLAALGVRRLQLIDPGTVARTTQAAEGYAHDDVGRPKVHAAAQVCHQLNPELEIQAVPKRSLRRLDLGDAVFLCPGWERMRRTLERTIGSPGAFVARCTLVGATIHIDAGCDARTWAARLNALQQPGTPPQTRRSAAVPIYAATIAAGLLVAEFARFRAGRRPSRAIRFDLQSLTLEVKEPP